MPREDEVTTLNLRITKELKDNFYEKAARHGLPSEVLREIVTAFVEDRLTIKPPAPNSKWKESLYVTRKEN